MVGLIIISRRWSHLRLREFVTGLRERTRATEGTSGRGHGRLGGTASGERVERGGLLFSLFPPTTPLNKPEERKDEQE